MKNIKTFEQFVVDTNDEMIDEGFLGILSNEDKGKISEYAKKSELTDEEAKSIIGSNIWKNAVNQTRAIGSIAVKVEDVARHRDVVAKEPIKYKLDILRTMKAAESSIRTGKKPDVYLEKGSDGLLHLAYKGVTIAKATF